METKHTPIPWHIDRDDDHHCAYIIPDEKNWDINPHQIAVVHDERIDNEWQGNNAEFIIRAVNNHDALFNALERLTEKVRRANDIRHSGGRIKAEDWSELYMLANEAAAILINAQGE